ncbi:hypothetical protein MLD38_035635 [Melastoma candidum]|uniref:Uncharacterized protein n=1 Tax=Melastoma candidum TaxID=119954 RepID=A0ACB9LH80_9MYRT|nr:hypothetical protein MLD38_035635 [Melastoma candidum]
MKASLKFREDQKPLVRAKIPLNILGLPFQSGVIAGNAPELTLNLSTAFNSGPSLRLSYRPNDSSNPFSLSLKTGSGPFGSPLSSFLSLSAHFNLLHHHSVSNPVFTLNFSPSLGDFSAKKKVRSLDVDPNLWRGKKVGDANGVNSEDDDSSIEVVENPTKVGFGGGGIGRFRELSRNVVDVPASVTGLLSGMEVGARSEVPVMGRAVVSFRWGVRVPLEPGALNSSKLSKFPFLVMDKIGIEHVYCCQSKESGQGGKKMDDGKEISDPKHGAGSELAEGWYLMRRQLDMLKDENGELRKAMDDLRHEFTSKRVGSYRDADRSSSVKSNRWVGNADRKPLSDASTGYTGKGIEGNTNEELKKALKGSAGA